MNIKKFHEYIHGTSIMIYQAHPFRAAVFPEKPEYLDGIEVYNGNPRHESHNEKAVEYAKKHNLKMISGSDFHQAGDLARGGIVLTAAPKDSMELAKMLAGGCVVRLIQNS